MTDNESDEMKSEVQNEPDNSIVGTEEAAVLRQISTEDVQDNVDSLYAQDAEPEEPTKIIGINKHRLLAKLKRPKFWFSVLGVLVVVLIFLWLITPTRLWLLNTFGVRAQLKVTALVAVSEGEPPRLKNATVTINGQDYATDEQGAVQANIKYGNTTIVVSKQGYESATSSELIDFDPFFHALGGQQEDQNILNQVFMLKSVGIAFTINAKDWLTEQPVTKGVFSIGDVNASPNGQGKVSLTIPATDQPEVELAIKFDSGYLNRTMALPTSQVQQDVILVPAGKHYFMSRQSGVLGLYSSNLDGSDIGAVLAPSANESGDAAFSVSPDQKSVIFASTREATHDSFGSVQQKLYAISAATKKIQPVDMALKFTLVDWYKDDLVYIATERDDNGKLVQRLTSVNKAFSTVGAAYDYVRVSASSVIHMQNGGDLRTIKINGGTEKSLGTGIKAITQTDAMRFAYQIQDLSWRQYDVNSDQVSVTATPTGLQRAFLASTSQDAQTELLVDTIDGKRTLLAKSVGGGQEKVLYAGNDLSAPIYWVGNVCVYRVGSADYVIDRSGSYPAKKITDVAPTSTTSYGYFNFN